MMRGRAGYGSDPVGEALAPFHKDRVSPPGVLGVPPNIADVDDEVA